MPAKQTILYLTKDSVISSSVSSAGVVTRNKGIPWDASSLSSVLSGIKKDSKGPYTVLLDDELVFTLGVSIPVDTKNEREFVKTKAEEEVPHALQEYGWDFKEVLKGHTVRGDEKIVQCIVAEEHFFEIFSRAIRESGMRINSIEPMSCAIARIVAGANDPVLIVHEDVYTTLIAAHKGLVCMVSRVEKEVTSAAMVAIVDFMKEKWSLVLKECISAPLSRKKISALSEEAHLAYKEETLEMEKGALLKNDGEGDDSESLSITISPHITEDEKRTGPAITGISEIKRDSGMGRYELISAREEELARYPQGKTFTILIFVISLLITLVNGYILYLRSMEQSAKVNAPVVQTVSTAPVEEVDISKYLINVLNGSGIAGSAGRAAEFLISKQFSVDETGNADRSDYPTSVIRYKKEVPLIYRQKIEQELKMGYTVTQGPELDSGEKVEVVLIIGLK
jgi:hypothetical protein